MAALPKLSCTTFTPHEAMKTQQIIIETSQKPDGEYRAQIVEGPGWTAGFGVSSPSRALAYRHLKALLRSEDSRCLSRLEFIHAEN